MPAEVSEDQIYEVFISPCSTKEKIQFWNSSSRKNVNLRGK